MAVKIQLEEKSALYYLIFFKRFFTTLYYTLYNEISIIPIV